MINIDGTGETRIGPGRWPDWSPDGTEIVFSMGGEETGGARIGATICIAKADGSARRNLTAGDCPSWSPDGKKIAYCLRTRSQPSTLHVFDMPENRETTLGIGWFRANWAPDSKSVVATRTHGRMRVLVRLTLADPTNAAEQSTEYEEPTAPFISWDGKEILFIARKPKSR